MGDIIKSKNEDKKIIEHYKCLSELALEIYNLWQKGTDVRATSIRHHPKFYGLYVKALRANISWQEVLISAGLPLDELKKRKSEIKRSRWPVDPNKRLSKLVQLVQELRDSGVDVSSTAIVLNPKYRRYYAAAYNIGITWEEVCRLAGIPMKRPKIGKWI